MSSWSANRDPWAPRDAIAFNLREAPTPSLNLAPAKGGPPAQQAHLSTETYRPWPMRPSALLLALRSCLW
eukprot:CAMPEP_0176307158 /NCGR_PEP_ID=MMETSP0121_2-20121125/63868_1 /TAXON_ID=160619 /ORGANISM="Kryptoperidinium foliaceum, Strain CCMP 1326" /LENGTH=69 /DNA_ID=CAMNT_0017648919 /DNA_START=116 /DNA_END=322 /DNA_ORIENTATION=+